MTVVQFSPSSEISSVYFNFDQNPVFTFSILTSEPKSIAIAPVFVAEPVVHALLPGFKFMVRALINAFFAGRTEFVSVTLIPFVS